MNGRREWRGSVPFDTQMPLDSDSNYAGRKRTGMDGAERRRGGRRKTPVPGAQKRLTQSILFFFHQLSHKIHSAVLLWLWLFLFFLSLFFFLQRINQIVITALSVTELRQNHSKRDHSFERGSDSAGGTEAVITQSGRDFDFDLRVSIAIHHCQLS